MKPTDPGACRRVPTPCLPAATRATAVGCGRGLLRRGRDREADFRSRESAGHQTRALPSGALRRAGRNPARRHNAPGDVRRAPPVSRASAVTGRCREIRARYRRMDGPRNEEAQIKIGAPESRRQTIRDDAAADLRDPLALIRRQGAFAVENPFSTEARQLRFADRTGDEKNLAVFRRRRLSVPSGVSRHACARASFMDQD